MKAKLKLAGHLIVFEGELDADGDLVRDIDDVTVEDASAALYDIITSHFQDAIVDALKEAYEQEALEMAILRMEADRDWAAQRDWEG